MMRTLAILFTSAALYGASLPQSLSSAEFDRVVEILGQGSVSRLMRSAESYPMWPGLRLGIDTSMVPTRDLNGLGDGTGSLPGSLFIPRIHITKGIAEEFEVGLNFFSDSIVKTLSTTGFTGKWTFVTEEDEDYWATAAVFGSYTSVQGLNSLYGGNDFEVGALVSKDFVRMKPYAGAGFLFAHGNISGPQRMEQSGWASTIHLFAGLEIETPLNITAQLDFMNLSPMASLFIGYSF